MNKLTLFCVFTISLLLITSCPITKDNLIADRVSTTFFDLSTGVYGTAGTLEALKKENTKTKNYIKKGANINGLTASNFYQNGQYTDVSALDIFLEKIMENYLFVNQDTFLEMVNLGIFLGENGAITNRYSLERYFLEFMENMHEIHNIPDRMAPIISIYVSSGLVLSSDAERYILDKVLADDPDQYNTKESPAMHYNYYNNDSLIFKSYFIGKEFLQELITQNIIDPNSGNMTEYLNRAKEILATNPHIEWLPEQIEMLQIVVTLIEDHQT